MQRVFDLYMSPANRAHPANRAQSLFTFLAHDSVGYSNSSAKILRILYMRSKYTQFQKYRHLTLTYPAFFSRVLVG